MSSFVDVGRRQEVTIVTRSVTLNGVTLSQCDDLLNISFIPSVKIPTMDLKDLSPGSMSAVLIFGIWKASSFSLSKFILELSLRVSESTAAWFWSFTRLENISQSTETSLTRPATTAGRKGERGGKKTLIQLFSRKYLLFWGLVSFFVAYSNSSTPNLGH